MARRINRARFHVNAASFQKAMLFEGALLPEVQLQVVRTLTLKIYAQIIRRSPVGRSGFYRASHNISVNAKDLSVPTTAQVSPNILGGLRGIQEGDTVWITTNLPYSEVIEHGLWGEGPKTVGGFSRQAPQGVYRVSIESVLGEFDGSDLVEMAA